MAHRSLSTLVFTGLVPTTAATVISLLGDDGLPSELRIVENLMYQPWQTSRSGLLAIGMDPHTDLSKVSRLIEDRTTWWEVAICLTESLRGYEPALLAQGAVKILPHPEDDLTGCRDEIRNLLRMLTTHATDALGLELADLIQLYGDKRVPKTIRIAGAGVIGSIYLKDGNIVHAETMDESEGMEAFTRIFAVRAPEIRIHNGCLTSRQSVNMPAMSVLLEGARVNDEDQRNESMTAGDHHDSLDEIAMLNEGPESGRDILSGIFDSEFELPSSTHVRKMAPNPDQPFDTDFDM
jgi:hypothetical protein